MYIVYGHLDSEDRVFFIGTGTGTRPFSRRNRSAAWKSIAEKSGYAVKIFAENLTKREASNLQDTLLFLYKTDGLTILTAKASDLTCSKISESKKAAWEAPSDAMLDGAKRSGLKRRGRTKETHSGVAAMAEKIKLKSQGESNPNHKWIWVTPKGEFASSAQASIANNVGRKTVERRCKKDTDGWSRKGKNHE